MALSRSKVAIIGMGNVGSALAHHLVLTNLCDDLILINRNRQKAWAEAMDLRHALGYRDTKMHVTDGTYEDCKDADIVVITASAPYVKGMSRTDLLHKSAEIMDEMIPKIMESGFDGIIINITNPVDSITQYIQKISKLPPQRVIGTGTSLDTARLRQILADIMDVDPGSVGAICLGEHGDSQVIPWSKVTVGEKLFSDILNDNKSRLQSIKLEQIEHDVMEVAHQIAIKKGNTSYGIASVTARMIKAIINDDNIVMPVSAYFSGEYQIEDVYAGIPVVLGKNGVKELVEYSLTTQEQKAFLHSANIIKEYNEQIKTI